MRVGLQLSRILMERIKHGCQSQSLNHVNNRNLRKEKRTVIDNSVKLPYSKQNKQEAEAVVQEACCELKGWPMSVKTRYFICAQ